MGPCGDSTHPAYLWQGLKGGKETNPRNSHRWLEIDFNQRAKGVLLESRPIRKEFNPSIFKWWWCMGKFLLFLSFFAVLKAHADWKGSWNAEVSGEGIHQLHRVNPDTRTDRGVYGVKAPLTLKNGRAFRVKALPIVQWDPQSLSKNEQFYRDLQEGYAQLQVSHFTTQVGFNSFNWGDSDVFNPLDVVNPRRYFDPFRPEKIGVGAALLKYDMDKIFVEAIYIPKQRKTLLPGEQSRWLPREFYRNKNIETSFGKGAISIPSNLQYHYVNPKEIDGALSNNYGMRAKYRLSGLDGSLIFFDGSAVAPAVNIPAIDLDLTSVSNSNDFLLLTSPNLFLQASYYRVRVLGTSFVAVLGDTLLKGAFAYTQTKQKLSTLPPDLKESVLGAERTFSWGKQTLTTLLQGTYVQRGYSSIDNNTVSLSRMFDRAGMLGLRWGIGEKWVVLSSYLRDIKFKGNLFHDEIQFKFRDGYAFQATADFLDGATETPLGTYKNNDRVSLGLHAQF